MQLEVAFAQSAVQIALLLVAGETGSEGKVREMCTSRRRTVGKGSVPGTAGTAEKTPKVSVAPSSSAPPCVSAILMRRSPVRGPALVSSLEASSKPFSLFFFGASSSEGDGVWAWAAPTELA